MVELFSFGEAGTDQSGIATNTVLAGFYEFLGFPRLLSAEAVRKAIVRGVETGLFGYVTGRPTLDENGRYQIDQSRVAFERSVVDDEIDLDSGFLIAPAALPEKAATTGDQTTRGDPGNGEPTQTGGGGGPGHGTDRGNEPPQPDAPSGREIALSFTADQSNLYAAWNALANLADLASEVSIKATSTLPTGYDKARLENGVLEPLQELGLINEEEG